LEPLVPITASIYVRKLVYNLHICCISCITYIKPIMECDQIMNETLTNATERANNTYVRYDEIDSKLVDLLSERQKATVAELCKLTGKSRSCVSYRMLSLAAAGIVEVKKLTRKEKFYGLRSNE
jgi:hypothetical protein